MSCLVVYAEKGLVSLGSRTLITENQREKNMDFGLGIGLYRMWSASSETAPLMTHNEARLSEPETVNINGFAIQGFVLGA